MLRVTRHRYDAIRHSTCDREAYVRSMRRRATIRAYLLPAAQSRDVTLRSMGAPPRFLPAPGRSGDGGATLFAVFRGAIVVFGAFQDFNYFPGYPAFLECPDGRFRIAIRHQLCLGSDDGSGSGRASGHSTRHAR
ncbi:hypothetical protein HPB50_011041 [Hyalomma asiaticum]|uniref:Uncharacterized protein n=1 Tax=Hyalomma asiaticum TaxID=266040 RepID=A0ACB7RIX6_HYAAI|nr:hypothetical protein HPB50_011041 [Hyalomma asiaticum]